MLVKVLLLQFTIVLSFELSSLKDFQSWSGCLSHHEAEGLITHFTNIEGGKKEVPHLISSQSIDLGMSKRDLFFDYKGIALTIDDCLAQNYIIMKEELDIIREKKNTCFALYDDGSKPWQINTISPTTDMPASLCPPLTSSGAPTLGFLV